MELFGVANQQERSALVVEDGSIVYQRDTHEVWVSLTESGATHSVVRLMDLPEPKEQHGFEACDGLLYAVCGITTGATHSKTMYAYAPTTNSWTRRTDAPAALQSPILRTVGEKLYLIGGYDSYIPIKYKTCYEYAPGADSWARKADMPTAREDAASAVVGGKIYVFGGLTNPGHTFAASIDIYDPASNTWETRSWAMPRALGDSGVAHNGKIYLIGGTADMSHYPTDLRASSETSVYDPATGTWTTGAVVPVPACYREIEELGGRLYAMSGTTQTVTTYTSDAIIYDPVTDVWDVLPDLVYAARGAGLTKCGDSLYLSGGFNGAYLNWLYRVRR